MYLWTTAHLRDANLNQTTCLKGESGEDRGRWVPSDQQPSDERRQAGEQPQETAARVLGVPCLSHVAELPAQACR